VRKILSSAAFLLFLLSLTSAAFAATGTSDGETRLLRYPDIHGDTLAFVYAGDIWIASAQGGVARRLTSGAGQELFPKFSPDGRWIAFTGQYTGVRQVYAIPLAGGTPRQLTFHNDVGAIPLRGGFDNQVMGWTPDGKQVLFNAHRTPWSDRIGRPHLVPVEGGMETPLPMPEGATGSLSPDGKRYAYAPVQHEWRGWKRYRGGRAPDVWVYDLKANTAERLTDDPASDNLPVWVGDGLYFLSDRDGHLNLYAYDFKTKAARQVTRYDNYDALWPSSDGKRIVYEVGGALHVFDPAAGPGGPGGQAAPVAIRVEGDLPHTLPYLKKVEEDIQAVSFSKTGKRVYLEARGDLFSVPAEKGEIRNLTATPGIRESVPAASPDGLWLAYLSDRTGESEVYVRPAAPETGSGSERRVTTDGRIWRFPPVWSPDSKRLAFGDKDRKLWVVDVKSGKPTAADQSNDGDITDYRWSPDSRFLAYTKTAVTKQPAIWIYAVDEGKARALTNGESGDTNPIFDPQGRYLYFLSNRDFNLTFSGFEQDYLYTGPTRVYAGLLAKDGPALFPPQSDEEKGADAPKEAKDAKAEAAVKVRIDFDGFESRVRALPGEPGSYQSLAASSTAVFYLSGTDPLALKQVDLESREEKTVLEEVADFFELSADGKKILYRGEEHLAIVDAKPEQKADTGQLDLTSLEIRVEPREEWRQMYHEAWRIVRDWFYDPNLHGVDWKALRDKYGALLPYVATRADLDFLLHELGAELPAGHVYVNSIDPDAPERVEGGRRGAESEAHSSGAFRVAHIFPGENWHEDFRSPLTEPGVKVKEGDFLLAVDGRSTNGVKNFYSLLDGKGDRTVTLLVNSEPSLQGAHEEKVKTVRSEQNLRYLDWALATAAKVDKLSHGRIGYIHLPNTAVEGNRELYKHFYPQTQKEALILDDRWNGGGFIPDRMMALLSRPLLNYWVTRGGAANTTPYFVHNGPKAALINGQAGSGGDAFPYYFRKLGLGKIFGTRTWGGLIGLSGNPPLIDGGGITPPTFRLLQTDGTWGVEGEGVAPDVEVIDRPDALAKGQDPSLEAAVDHLLQELAKNPPQKLVVPPPPGARP
jgi:tricorn protease